MTQLTLTKTSLIAGIWHGDLHGAGEAEPDLLVQHLGEDLPGLTAAHDGKIWRVQFTIPTDCISDGVQSFVIKDRPTGATLSSFAIVAGDALADDMRAEVDLLRAELDMLKRAFRRHCLETM